MTARSAEISTAPPEPPIRAEDLDPANELRRLAGRNRTKADLVLYGARGGRFAIKDYSRRPWWMRNTLGRWLTRRECRAYRTAEGLHGLPRWLGRVGPFALAVEWIDAPTLAERADGSVSPGRFDRLREILLGLHARAVALADLSHRDVLLGAEGQVWVVDLAAAHVRGDRPGQLRRRLHAHFCASDLFALARLRCRFTGEEPGNALIDADPGVVAWHRRARRLKWYWDKLRGAPRLPPVDDHWRF
jgi:hypothetical protein